MSPQNTDIYSTATLFFFWFYAGCPYFASQTMAEAAQLVFCPYNYLISPIVRRAMDIDITGSVVILDEAQ
jgi:Rad3-related DNA helicase